MYECEPVKSIEKDVKAKKVHRCGECSKVIEKGERYLLLDVWVDNKWKHHRACMKCKGLGELYQKETGDCWPIGGLFEAIKDCGLIDEQIVEAVAS